MRRSLFLGGFLLSAAVLLGALGWVSRLSVNLEAREREARQRAAFEERVRLALWRMDAAVAGLLTLENARPVAPVAPRPPGMPGTPGVPETPATPDTAGEAAAGGPEAAPAAMPMPYLAARFEIGPTGEVREWATARRGPGPAGAAALRPDVLLAALRQGPLASRPRPIPGRMGPPRAARNAAPATPVKPAPPAGTAATAPAAVPQQTAPASALATAATLRPAAAPTVGTGTAPAADQASQPRQAAAAGNLALPAEARTDRKPERAEDPVAREMAKQTRLNQVEFEKRAVQNQNFGAQTPFEPRAAGPSAGAAGTPAAEASPAAADTPVTPPPGPPSRAAGSPAARSPAAGSPATRSPAAGSPAAGSPAASLLASAPGSAPSSAPAAAAAPSGPPRQAPSTRQAPSRARPRRPSSAQATAQATAQAAPGRALGSLSAVWVGDDLILARRVARGGEEYLQGLRLDGPGTREWLAAQARDLLPRAALLPLLPGDSADPGRRLALLPLRLDAGPLPAATAGAGSPVRLGLAVAGVAVLLSIGAAGLQLAAALRLARRRADFVSAVTHELRTPLTTFRLYTEMLAGDMVPAAERPAYVGTLRDEADRLGHLVDNVLAFARLERGRAEAKVEVVELVPLVAEAAARLARRVERDGLTLATEVPPEAAAARVQVDRIAVERILQNLADNACKYGHNAADPRLHLTVRLGERRALLTLRDHGRGLDRRGRRRLFRPFHRSAEQATGDAPGVGLGLALSRRLARGFGGDLRAVEPAAPAGSAQQGTGAAFELSLPLAT